MKGETLKIFQKKFHTAEKGEGSSHNAAKMGKGTSEKLAHTHRFEHETSGLKSKHLTIRPRTPELRLSG